MSRQMGRHPALTISLLLTLSSLNAQGKLPSMTELIREESPTETLLRNTIESRRALLRVSIARGHVSTSPHRVGKACRLMLSTGGAEYLASHGWIVPYPPLSKPLDTEK